MTLYTANSIVVPIQPNIEELVRLNIPTLSVLSKWETKNEVIKWDLNIGGATATGEAVTADVTAFNNDAVDLASLPIATHRFRSSFQILETKYTAAAEAARNGSPDELANILNYSSQSARREILRALGSQIFSGTGNAASGGVIGLEATVANLATADTTGVNKTKSSTAYAGIDPATSSYSEWTSLIHSNFGKITKAKLRAFDADLINGSTTGVPGMYDTIIMNPETANYYIEAFDVAFGGVPSVQGASDLGYQRLSYNGRPIIEDPNCSLNVMHFVDSNAVRLYSFSQEQRDMFSDEMPSEGLLTYIKTVPSNNPQMVKLAMFGMFQLQLRDRSALATIKGITP